MTIGIVAGVLLLMLIGYAVQLFRLCEICYPDCPIECFREGWYTVSHEGNRYGVTFHNRRFAKYFMRVLEERYGPWNTANILKIKRDEEEYVVLSIFFHDHFTPWFYTQGPIKHDEEWIKTDFREMCEIVKEHLYNRNCCHLVYTCIQRHKTETERVPSDHEAEDEVCLRLGELQSDQGDKEKSTVAEEHNNEATGTTSLIVVNEQSSSCSSTTNPKGQKGPPPTGRRRYQEARSFSVQLSSSGTGRASSIASNTTAPSNRPRHSLRPWTKASFREFQLLEQLEKRDKDIGANTSFEDIQLEHALAEFRAGTRSSIDHSARRCSIAHTSLTTGGSSTDATGRLLGTNSNNAVVIHFIDATVDSNGNNKATQTTRQVRIS